jgi:acetyltransferase-like isoleucine patch superfamily enzyme
VKAIRKLVRLGALVWSLALSSLRKLWCQCRFSGVRFGRNVHLSRGVAVLVADGGRLEIGDNVHVAPNVRLTADRGVLSIGANSFIGDGSILVAAERVTIGGDVLIAAYVTVRDQDHGVGYPGTLYRVQPLLTAPVTIGRNVWLGTHATVLRGIVIGDNAIIGANAVVTRDVAANSVSAGVPARQVRSLGNNAPGAPQKDTE